MPRFLLLALLSLAYALIFAYSGTFAHPYAYRHKWYPRQWRPTPYTGKASQPLHDTPEQFKRCRQQIENTGHQLREQLRQNAQVLEIITPGPYTRCPTTGLSYRIVRWDAFVVICPFHPHPGALVLWDSRGGQQLDAWRTPATLDDDGRLQENWLRAYTAYYSDDFQQAVKSCEKFREAKASEADELLIDSLLALGEGQRALKVYEQSPNRKDLPLSQWNCLLELGRFQEVLQSDPSPVQKCMAELYLDQTEQAAQTLEQVKQDALFEAYALLALKRYPEARKKCQEVIHDGGWQVAFAGNAIVVGVLSDWLGGAPEEQTRAFLQKGLDEAPRAWPYPILRYLNREICEEELLEIAAPILSHRVESQFTIGLALLARQRDTAHARDLLSQAAGHGQFFEGMAAHCLLK
ncbi:MAG: hypothetical protein KF760_08505 [Candidatus Eremiobacteraeota bacterium]|nr:hypothetical protein [Candidatus Eremiobacteraeota bacterium]MCW5872199.1 hypothetical protein [Candidatus Eremiobacteraeota bacterium]